MRGFGKFRRTPPQKYKCLWGGPPGSEEKVSSGGSLVEPAGRVFNNFAEYLQLQVSTLIFPSAQYVRTIATAVWNS